MSRGRSLGAIVAIALSAGGLAGCGGSGKSTTNVSDSTAPALLDPATKVPASALAYALVTIKPGDSLQTDLVATIDKLAGPGAADKLAASITSQLGSATDIKAFKRWFGPQIGVALTGLPKSGSLVGNSVEPYAVVVAPSSQPARLKQYIAAHLHNPAATVQAVGNYVIVGGKRAVAQSVATSRSRSLAANPAYSSSVSQIGGNQLATIYVRPQPLVQGLTPLLNAQASGMATQLANAFKNVPAHASVVLGVGAGTNTLRIDVVTSGLPKSATASTSGDVSSLPASSWLALAFNIDSNSVSKLQSELPALINQAQASAGSAGAAGSAASSFLPFLEQYLVPALGPLSVSISGDALPMLQVGIQLTPHNAAAGDKLVGEIKQLVTNLPIEATKVGNQVVVSYGYVDPKDLTSPSSTLGDDPTFKAALGQLPAGSKAPLYVNFGPIASFSALDSRASDSGVWKVVRHLRYLIEGGTSTHVRIVLAVK